MRRSLANTIAAAEAPIEMLLEEGTYLFAVGLPIGEVGVVVTRLARIVFKWRGIPTGRKGRARHRVGLTDV